MISKNKGFIILTKENTFLKIITYAPLVLIPLFTGLLSLFYVTIYNQNFEKELKEVEKKLYAAEKESLKVRIGNIANIITYRESVITQDLKNRVQLRVNQAYNIAKTIYLENKDIKSDKEIQQEIVRALRAFSWNNKESYIWIIDFNGTLNLGPTNLKYLEGKSIINLKDAKGELIIQDEINICKKNNKGFLWDSFTKPNENTNKHYKQLAFVKSLGHFNWYIGSAEFLDTATKKSNKILLNEMMNIDSVNQNYTFLIDSSSRLLMNKTVINKNYTKKINSQKTNTMIKKINSALENKDSAFITYKWLNPKNNIVEEKYTYIERIPTVNWIIGSGFYLSDINNKLSKQKVNMYDIMYSESNIILYTIFIGIFISLLFSYYVTNKLKENFTIYKGNINMQKNQLLVLNETLEAKVKHRTKELEEMKNTYEELATIDALTNLHNRYSIMNLFEIEIERAHRYDSPLSVLIFDIDFFKKVNDTYGHSVGDDVLTTLSKIVTSTLRTTDMAGRYGGEEFLLLLPNSTIGEANICPKT